MHHQKTILISLLLALILGGGVYVGSNIYSKANHPLTTPLITSTTPSPLPIIPSPSPVIKPSKTTLTFGGDIMLGRAVERNMRKFGYSWPLEHLAPTLKDADLTIANLESPFRSNAVTTTSNSLVLRGDPNGIVNLTNAGIDLVSLANNHITDMGTEGLHETFSILSTNGIRSVGAGTSQTEALKPEIIEKNGIKFGFLSFSYGVNIERAGIYYNKAEISTVTTAVTTLKSQADIVIVLCHCGIEYQPTASTEQQAFFHAAIDAGATLVIGHHPHVPEPVERYKHGLIIYSLGNLVFDQQEIGNRNFSALASIVFEGNALSQLTLLPYQIFNLGQPRLLTDQANKERIWRLFQLPTGSMTF